MMRIFYLRLDGEIQMVVTDKGSAFWMDDKGIICSVGGKEFKINHQDVLRVRSV